MRFEIIDVGRSVVGIILLGIILRRMPTSIIPLIVLALSGASCTSKDKDKSEVETSATSGAITHSAERGRTIYQTQCIACHNPDPHKPGSIGPDVFGSSRELLEARIMHGNYPPGYTPKRTTHAMVPLPHLKNEIDSIHDYLKQQ